MLYRRGRVWWYKFQFAGRQFQESSRSRSKAVATRAERQRRRELEEGINGLKRRTLPQPFSVAAAEWLEMKKPTLALKSHRIEKTNLGHLRPRLGKLLLTDIGADEVARCQRYRQREGAAPKTINLEVGTLRAILRRHRLWAQIQPDVKMLPVSDNVRKALNHNEENRILTACGSSRSRSLLPAVTLALNTGLRYSEIRLLRWEQVDLTRRLLIVGKSKTETGSGRGGPLNDRPAATLRFWASNFPLRRQDHFVFPTERYGAEGRVYGTDPTRPIGSWKEGWETAMKKAGVLPVS